jgi:hypothetical protein
LAQRTVKLEQSQLVPEAKELVWWKETSGADGWVAENITTTVAMTEDDYRQNIANIYLLIKYLQERIVDRTRNNK